MMVLRPHKNLQLIRHCERSEAIQFRALLSKPGWIAAAYRPRDDKGVLKPRDDELRLSLVMTAFRFNSS